MDLGYVGLGKMGGALARRLMREHTLRAYDLRPAVVQEFAAAGALPVQNLRAMASACDLVMTCLPTSSQVRDVIFGDDGLAQHLKPGSLIADMTTGDPNATREMAAQLKPRGISLIDAPVSGGPHGAEAGTIAIMVGAPAELLERVLPVLKTISPNIFHTGDVGTGHLMKLVNNVIAASVRAVTFEAIAMGIKNGLTLETCAAVLPKGSARSYTTEITLPKLRDGSLIGNFLLGLMHKDVRLATEMGIASGAPMPIAGLVRELYQEAVNEHGYDADINMLIRSCERAAQTKIVP
ncbi:MAG: NAD(P)-dependent oxidoreductase [Proteobacteria bacterium]|nr:NAD(P)-dependent oxidoreductase [Pseudomonadota bacterium]